MKFLGDNDYLYSVNLSFTALVVKNQFLPVLFFTPAFSQVLLNNKLFFMNIYVSNLGFNVKDEDLNGLFRDFGTVSSAKVITDKLSTQSRGFGFVEMSDENAAQKAIKELNGIMVDGRSIKVSEARPKENRSNRDFTSKRY